MNKYKKVINLNQMFASEHIWIYVLILLKESGEMEEMEISKSIEKEFGLNIDEGVMDIVTYKLLKNGLIEKKDNKYKLSLKGMETLENLKKYFLLIAERL